MFRPLKILIYTPSVTHGAWLSAGWPEWIAMQTSSIDPGELNTELNKVFGIMR